LCLGTSCQPLSAFVPSLNVCIAHVSHCLMMCWGQPEPRIRLECLLLIV
jgi:hypothetical protein